MLDESTQVYNDIRLILLLEDFNERITRGVK